ncbi:MAG: glycosyltransferase family 1 protein [Candidatus Eisenbacteria bacterium]|nr:glycosyltransferase family 1 protein [Candidatus Eisenbacteria bacterium]
MRVCLDGRPVQPGFKRHKNRGIGTYAENLLSYLPALAPHVQFSIIFEKNKPVDERFRRQNVDYLIHSVPGLLSLNHPIIDAFAYLPLTLQRCQADVIHFFSHLDAPWFGMHKKAVVVTVHDAIPLVFPELYHTNGTVLRRGYQRALKSIVRGARIVIADSECSKRDAVTYLSAREDRVRVIYLGVDPVFERVTDPEKLAAVREKHRLVHPFIFYLGGIDPRKNVRRLLAAYAGLIKRSAFPHDLVIAGDIRNEPEFPELEREIQATGMEERIRLLGFVATEECPALYSAADCFVFPSLYEGFGLPLLEAMACGTAVISSDRSSLPEIVGDSGLIVNCEDVDAIAAAMAAVLGTESLRHDLGARGMRQAKLFSWGKTAAETLAVYEEVVRTRRKPLGRE